MATTPTSTAALEAYLDKRFSAFEDRTCLLLCQISTGAMNRETKEHNILTKHIRDLMDRVSALETPHEKPDIARLPFRYKSEKRIA
jgi:hypothetical protein